MPRMSSPFSRRTAAEQALLEARIIELFEQSVSFNRSLGFRIDPLAEQAARMRFDMRPDLVGHYHYGRLHGGVIASALDAVGSLGLLLALANKHADESADQVLHRFSRMGTIDLRVDYLRQGLGSQFVATAEVTRLGGRLGSTLMRLVNDSGTLIATGAAVYVVS
jgi:uncharacterized protein (TIGR00369 family)